jgi:hypothetical protein
MGRSIMSTKRPRPLGWALPALLLLLGGGCDRSLLDGGVHEGVIIYKLSFPEMDPNGLMAGMLPEQSELSFSEGLQSMDLSAGMGLFRTSMLINTPAHEVDYHMSMMGKNLYARYAPRDLEASADMPPPVQVVYSDARDTIAGYPCKKAYLIYRQMDRPEETVWYTDAIRMPDPNWYSPFRDIPGVLMRYELTQHHIRIRLEASSVTPGKVDPKKFAPKPGHEEVTPAVLDEQLDEVLGTFQQ